MNWISPTGLSPCAAMPTQSPPINASDNGVSNTRSAPKRCCRPAVARNTPPFSPTSSPNTTTSGSSPSARASARLMASTSVISAIVRLGFVALPGVDRRQRRIEMIEHGFRTARWRCEVAFDCGVDLLAAGARDFLFLRLAPVHPRDEIVAQPRDRLGLPTLLDLLRRPIARGVV